MASVSAIVLGTVLFSSHAEGLTYVWNQDNSWSNDANWQMGGTGGGRFVNGAWVGGGNFNGLVDFSVPCVNEFNAEDTSDTKTTGGMAIGLDMDISVGTLKMPLNGKIVIKNGNRITFTGGDASTGTKSWHCRERVSTSSICPDNYLVFNGTTPINTTEPPCYEDTVIVDFDVVSSMTWHPGHYIKELVIARGVNLNNGQRQSVIASWGGDFVNLGMGSRLDYDSWEDEVTSRFAGNAPHINASMCSSGTMCQLFCLSSCPVADVNDPDLALQFGSNVTQDDIDAALDNAIRQRAALGRMQNELLTHLGNPDVYTFNVRPDAADVVADLPCMVASTCNTEATELLGRATWIEGLFLGWNLGVIPNTTDWVFSQGQNVGRQTFEMDYNIAWTQALYGLNYLATLTEQPANITKGAAMVGYGIAQGGSQDVIVATSGKAVAVMLDGNVTSGQTAVGPAGDRGIMMREYIRNYLTNERVQTMCRYFQNETEFNEATEMGSISEADWSSWTERSPAWEANIFNRSDSDGTYHHSAIDDRRMRRMPVAPVSTQYPGGGEGLPNTAKDRMIEAANRFLKHAVYSQTDEETVEVLAVGGIRCGAAHFHDAEDNNAQGACNLSSVQLTMNTVRSQAGISLVSPEIYEAVFGMVATQMSMHAVGVQLNQSIISVDASWAAFTATDDEDEGLPMMIIIAGAAGLVVLCLLIAIIVIMSGGEAIPEDKNRNVVAFENPMYDDPTGGAAADPDGDEDGGLYDEPAFNAAGDTENPMYASNEDNAAADTAGGYLDVEPDDGDDDDDDDDDDDGDGDDDDDDDEEDEEEEEEDDDDDE